jgi:hypothetical protein
MLGTVFTARAINQRRQADDAFQSIDFPEESQLLFQVGCCHFASVEYGLRVGRVYQGGRLRVAYWT